MPSSSPPPLADTYPSVLLLDSDIIGLAKNFVCFFVKWHQQAQLSLTSLETVLLHCIVTAVISKYIKKQNKTRITLGGVAQYIDCLLACKPKGHRFNSQLGHMPGLWAGSPVGVMREATNQCFSCTLIFPSLFLSLIPSL